MTFQTFFFVEQDDKSIIRSNDCIRSCCVFREFIKPLTNKIVFYYKFILKINMFLIYDICDKYRLANKIGKKE